MKALLASVLILGIAIQKNDEDFFKRWLDQDVVYIIAKEELAAAKRLKTPEEKDAFIQSFWERRDPTPGTIANEYRDEHYRRIAKANEKYTEATDGWRTDRGKVYIRFGEPDNVERNDSAGSATMRSGNNRILVPFETWDYRNIPGIGPAKLTFVDKTMTGHFELTLNPSDKIARFSNEDAAFMNSDPNNLLTMTETPESADWSRRISQYIAVQKPPEIKFRDLKAMVNVRLAFNVLPFNIRVDTLRGPGDKSIVPITLQFDSNGLAFQETPQGRRASVNVYGVVTDLSGKAAYEFEDAVLLNDATFFQRFITLDPGRYKLTVIARDPGNSNAGRVEQVVTIPRPQKKLSTSSLMLSDILVPAAPSETLLDNFVISRYKVRPLVRPDVSRSAPLGVYLEIYDFSTDPVTHQPDISATLRIFRKGQGLEVINVPVTVEDLSTHYIDRLLFAKSVRVTDLSSGEYLVRFSVTDKIRKETVGIEAPVTIKD